MILVPPQLSQCHSSDPPPPPPPFRIHEHSCRNCTSHLIVTVFLSNSHRFTRHTHSMVVESPVSLTFSNTELPIPHIPPLTVNNAGSSTTPPPPLSRQPVARHLPPPLDSLHSLFRHHRRAASVGR